MFQTTHLICSREESKQEWTRRGVQSNEEIDKEHCHKSNGHLFEAPHKQIHKGYRGPSRKETQMCFKPK